MRKVSSDMSPTPPLPSSILYLIGLSMFVQLMGDTVDKTLDDLNTNLTDQEILRPEAENDLNNLTETGVENIDFQKFLNEVRLVLDCFNIFKRD